MAQYLIHYAHDDCTVDPGVTWEDTWSCACNGECPACGTSDIEPVSWDSLTPGTKVVIEIHEGTASVIECPEGVAVEIRDYDTEGCSTEELADLEIDEDGNRYFLAG